MKLFNYAGIVLALTCSLVVKAQASADTVWLCRDTAPELEWAEMNLADTFPDNRGMFKMVDTGASLNGSMYINFNYQFTEAKPGYAGFKIFWDEGVGSFWVKDHDSLIFWHKGPLPGHKVKLVFGQGSAGCGTPINYEVMGEFTSSAAWKRISLPFPATGFVKEGLFELRVLIYNETGTTPTSAPGCLKIDNMYFFNNPESAVRNPQDGHLPISGSSSFVPTVSGKVSLTIFSLQGEQLFKESVDVTAGTKYNVGRFALKNSNLPANWISCVQIKGAGVNITRKVFR